MENRTNIAERFTAFQRSTAGQQPLRRPRAERAREDETERMAPRPTTGQLFDHRRHDPLRFAALNNSQKHPPAPSTSGHSATDLSDARSIASSAFTLTSGTSASSASFNNPNSPLTQAAPTNPFLQQLKRTYRDLCNKENKIVSPGNGHDDDDLDTSRSGVSIVEPHSATGDDVWLRRIRDHKDLVEQSHTLLRMSLSPSVPLTIQAIPKKYNIPARLWSVGFYKLLESLRQASAKSPAAFEHLHEYIYYAYGFYSCLFEDDSLASFRPSWIEALGDLARYRMKVAAHLASAPVPIPPAPTPLPPATLAVPAPSMNLDPSPTPSIGPQAAAEFDLEDERDIWRNRASDWYSIGLKDQPGIGKLHHHLGLLCRDEPGFELRSAYHFVKSMIASHPFDMARESIQPLFSVDAQRARMREANAGPVAQFVLLLGLLFTRIQLDDFDTVLARFVERLEIGGASAVREAEWIMISVCCIGAMLEFGRPDGVIKARGGLSQRSAKPGHDSRRDGDIEMEDAHEDAEDLSRPMQALSTSAPASDDELPHHFTLAVRLFCAVLRFVLRQPKIRATPPYGPQYNPFLTIGLTFLASVITAPAVRSAVERHVPWAQLAAFAAYVVKRRAANAEVSAGAKGRLVSLQGGALPEDWCVRGTVWVRRMYMQGFWRVGRWSGEGDILDAMPVRDGVVEDGDIDGNGSEDGAAVLERGRCARLGAAVGAIVEHIDGMRWEDDVASRSRLCLVEGALKSKIEKWEREEREEEEERERRKRWGANNRMDMDVDEEEVVQDQEDSEDDMEVDEEIRVLKARRRELRARAAAQTSTHRKTRPAGRRPSATPARPTARIVPGYTVLVLDTNIFLSALPTVAQLVSSQRWTVVVPLAVVTELDGLSRQSEAAQRAISFLEAQVRSGQGVGLGLKIQTSRGNYLPSLAVRAEQLWGSNGGWERNMDDFILRSAMWQMDNFIDRSGFLSTPSANGEGVKAKVVLVSSDRNLRVKARARELEAGDVNILAGLA
ncbi:Large family of predicted nucleotide-binding domains [Rhizoctonia solani]|uniref:Large family of predicted nucleotide-binding domains n=1 Tax=Rhizoctonia solani TaxID=456999 RepID=A0A8H7LPI9_9AGAM|nr:Large family of predicted nucleotide-binding domains [Rhizoctonia solani]